MLQKNTELIDTTKKPPIGVHKGNFQISYDLAWSTDVASSNQNKYKPSPSDATNDSSNDLASELSTFYINVEK